MVFNDGDLHEKLPLTGIERHAFFRATEEGSYNIPPLFKTVRSHQKLKMALHYKGTDLLPLELGRSEVEAPLLVIPDVQTSAFTSEQAGALGGQSVVLSTCGGLNLDLVFTETSGGAPDGMFIPVASVFAYEPSDSASGVSFWRTAVVCFKLEVLGSIGKREFALAGEDDKPVTGKGAKLYVLPISTLKSRLSLPDWRVWQEQEIEQLIGSALLQSPVFAPVVSAGLLPPDPQVCVPPRRPSPAHLVTLQPLPSLVLLMHVRI